MKHNYNKRILFVIVLFPLFCFSQIRVEYNDFNITDNVLMIEEYSYKRVTLNNHEIGDIENKNKLEFDNGLLIKSEKKFNSGFGENVTSNYYQHTKPFQEFIHYDVLGKGTFVEIETYKKQNFAGLDFYLPSTNSVIIKNIPNEDLEFKFKDTYGLSSGIHKIKRVNKNVQYTSPYFLGTYTVEYDSKKRPVKDLGSSLIVYTYNKDGLLIETKETAGPISYLGYFFYEKDKYGNWVKKIRTHKEDGIYYTARKLTYKNGDITGSTNYDLEYISSFRKKMNAGEYEDYINRNKEKSISNKKVEKKNTPSKTKEVSDSIKLDSDIAYCQSKENESKCLADKLSNEIDSLEKQGKSETEIDAFLQNKIKSIADYNIEVLYNSYLKINREDYKRIAPIIKKLPQSQQNQLKSFAQKTISNYSKEQSKNSQKTIDYYNNRQNKTTSNSTPKPVVRQNERTTKTGCISGDCENGKGTYVWDSGNMYNGNWKNGLRIGKGEFIWVNGDTYIGDFIDNNKTGYGSYVWNSGSRYEGVWLNDKREGKGSMIWPSGNKYEGSWKNDKRNGYGILIWTGGEKYKGDWINDVKEGKGIYYWENGSRYEGDWLNDEIHGYGKEYDANGELTFEGEYRNGKKIKAKD